MGVHVKYSLFLSDFIENIQISNLMKFSSVAAEFVHVELRKEGRTNTGADRHDKLIFAFDSFANEPKTQQLAHKQHVKHINMIFSPTCWGGRPPFSGGKI
jgi:hypothetical protein